MPNTNDPFSLSYYSYHLPQELIAQTPVEKRDESRLMIVNRESGKIKHCYFKEIADYIPPGSLMTLNDTKVIPARLYAAKKTGGRLEILLICPLADDTWEAMIKGRVKPGVCFNIENKLSGKVINNEENGRWRIKFDYQGDFNKILTEFGHPPLPPYIKRKAGEDDSCDKLRYQTVYAKAAGAIAAPTAGLHFTESIFNKISAAGIQTNFLTLHVGPGTFLPVKFDDIRKHNLEREIYTIPKVTAEAVNKARAESRRVIAVGTSTLRALESAKNNEGIIQTGTNNTELFIMPGYIFCSAYGLLTNFHLPHSTNLMLVSTFAGHELTMHAYNEAVAKKYRFYSYGDAMLIV